MKIKTIQQVTSQSLKDAVKTAYGRGGVRNFYAGFGVHVLCEGPGRGETYDCRCFRTLFYLTPPPPDRFQLFTWDAMNILKGG